MFRKSISAVMVLPLLAFTASPARAQWAVIDVSAIAQLVQEVEELRHREFVGIGGRPLRYSRSKSMSSANVGGIFSFPLRGVGETMWVSGQLGGQYLLFCAALGARGFPRIAVV